MVCPTCGQTLHLHAALTGRMAPERQSRGTQSKMSPTTRSTGMQTTTCGSWWWSWWSEWRSGAPALRHRPRDLAPAIMYGDMTRNLLAGRAWAQGSSGHGDHTTPWAWADASAQGSSRRGVCTTLPVIDEGSPITGADDTGLCGQRLEVDKGALSSSSSCPFQERTSTP